MKALSASPKVPFISHKKQVKPKEKNREQSGIWPVKPIEADQRRKWNTSRLTKKISARKAEPETLRFLCESRKKNRMDPGSCILCFFLTHQRGEQKTKNGTKPVYLAKGGMTEEKNGMGPGILGLWGRDLKD